MNKDGRFRIIVDTNLWISFLIGKRLSALSRLLLSGRIVIVMSTGLMDEIMEVASRPKFAKYFAPTALPLLTNFFRRYAVFYELEKIPARCRDPKDDYLLELAVASDADFLISGDSDLTDMGTIRHTRIVSYTELLQILEFEQ